MVTMMEVLLSTFGGVDGVDATGGKLLYGDSGRLTASGTGSEAFSVTVVGAPVGACGGTGT